MDLIEQLKRDEGLRLSAYRDSLGLWTIGYGHKMNQVLTTLTKGNETITEETACSLLEQDIRVASEGVIHFSEMEGLSEVRIAVLINMAFNIGMHGLLEFRKMFLHLRSNEFPEAAYEMRNSLWHKQVGDRAERLAKQMETGEWV